VAPPIDLLAWLEDPSEHHGIRFARDGDAWEFHSFRELAGAAREVAARLVDTGVEPGAVVSIVIPTGPLFVATYFGTLLAGLVPAPHAPATIFQQPEEYVEHTAHLIGAASSLVATEPAMSEIVGRATTTAGLQRAPLELEFSGDRVDFHRRPAAELALLQFTSGSSGRPRGVRVTWANLAAMIDYIFQWLPWGPEDAGVHWLPLHHDFGLIGCMLAPTAYQRDMWSLRPDQFIRTPSRWLECFGREHAAFAATPGFSFHYLLRKLDRTTLEGQDFSGWKGAIIGAERIDPAVLGDFARMLEPHGFRPETYLPAYGLAEATLGVTGLQADQRPRAVQVQWSSLQVGERVEVLAIAEVGAAVIGDGSGWLVGCGHPHEGLSIRILDDQGEPVGERHLGEIEVNGPTVGAGYLGAREGGVTAFTGEGLRTGDAGFLVDGELFVVGRQGDAVKLRGRSVYAEELEAKLFVIDGVPRGRCVVIPGSTEEGEALVAIVEAPPGDWCERAQRVLAKEAGPEVEVRVWSAPPGTIPRTSSGKPRRRMLWQRFVRKSLTLQPVHANYVAGS
jgi:acyl-CoA synthetase (AMP-forming)/AMP-acid ligase II